MLFYVFSFNAGTTILDNTKPEDSSVAGVSEENVKTPELPLDQLFTVTAVVDGDTLKINNHDEIETVRMIGIDTPETVHPSKPVECYGKEASDYLKELIDGKQVYIEMDPTQGERDTYGRLLSYVYLSDKTLVNKRMIEEGFAYEYTYQTPYKFQPVFKQAQKDASDAGKGLWGDLCQGSRGEVKGISTEQSDNQIQTSVTVLPE